MPSRTECVLVPGLLLNTRSTLLRPGQSDKGAAVSCLLEGACMHTTPTHSCHFAFYCSTLTHSTLGTRQRANMYTARREAHADVDALLAAKHVSRAKHRGHRMKQIVQWSTGGHLPITPMIPPPVPTTTASPRPPSQSKHFDEPLQHQHQRTSAGSSD